MLALYVSQLLTLLQVFDVPTLKITSSSVITSSGDQPGETNTYISLGDGTDQVIKLNPQILCFVDQVNTSKPSNLVPTDCVLAAA